MADIPKLKTLLASPHPVSGAWHADNSAAAAQGNEVDMEEDINSLSGDQLFTATDSGEFAGLTDVKRQLWVSWCNSDRDPHNATNVAFVNFIFGPRSAYQQPDYSLLYSKTIAALALLRKRAVSLFQKEGVGLVRAGHIQNAR